MKYFKKIALLTCILVPGLMAGCAGHEWSTEHYLLVPAEMRAADRAIAEAEEAGKDVQCPDEFHKARDMRDRAYDVYRRCRTAEAIELAKKAADKARRLCLRETARGTAKEKGPEEVPATRASLTVHFEFDKAEIRPSQTAALDRAVDFLKEHPECGVVIKGHTCSIGTNEYNQGLSVRRAKAARRYILERADGNVKQVTLSGFGESRPAASNATEAGRRLNRRAVAVTVCPD